MKRITSFFDNIKPGFDSNYLDLETTISIDLFKAEKTLKAYH